MEKKLCIVTGAAGGIGSRICETFIENGYHVVMSDRSETALNEAMIRNGFHEDDVSLLPVDITKEAEVEEKIAEVVARYGQIDALVNAAGIGGQNERIGEYSFADFKKVYEVNVFGTFLMSRAVLKQMDKQGYGAIVNMGSVSGMRGYSFEVAYGPSKWAVIGMSQAIANEYGRKGIRCNSVSPGWVDTAMMAETLENYKKIGIEDPQAWIRFGPIARPGEPKEIAEAVYFLCSDKASYINGANLVVDGGLTIR